MNKDNNDLPNKCIKLIEYDSNNVFKIYNKVINKEYGRWIEIYNKLKEFSQEIKKPINIIVKKPFLGFHSQGMRIIENDKISIKIWGINPPYLVHELVHFAYLKNLEINIAENKKALKIYKIELKLFNKILKISKLDKFIWLRKLIN